MQYFFCKLVQMDRLNSVIIDYFQICSSKIPPKIFALKYSAFSVNWCKCPILVG